MQKLIRGTTPKISIELPPGLSQSDISELWLTFSQKNELFTKNLQDMTLRSDGSLSVKLTQAETLLLSDCGSFVRVQARMKTTSGEATATDILTVSTGALLKDGEI